MVINKWIIVILFSYYGSAFAQSEEMEIAVCTKIKSLSKEQRMSYFPFSETATIKIVVFKNKNIGGDGEDLMKHIDSIHLKQDFFNAAYYDEVATLKPSQINQLTDIFFNYGYRNEQGIISVEACYMPRNVIFFLDKSNKIIAYLELCFACNNYRVSNNEIDLGHCRKKMDLIKTIFSDHKIKYGIEDTYRITN